jgi:hypothetical protein
MWSYQVPEVIDPNERLVTMKVVLDETVFSFDNSTLTISQIKAFDASSNQTISFTLKNDINVT